jgi:hypothetical protein
VQADLAQVTAIGDYAQARAAVATSQQAVTLAADAVRTAVTAQSGAQAAQDASQGHLNLAAARVRDLAISAYMGLGFLNPAAGPQQNQQNQGSDTGTVSSPGGLSGLAAMDAMEMLRVVGQRERHDLQASRVTVRQATRTTRAAAQKVAGARASLSAAQSALAATSQTLVLVTRAATTPGLAARVTLPDFGLDPYQTTSATLPPANGASTAPAPASPSILGPSVLSGGEMARWFASTHRKAHTTVPMPQLANDYAAAGQQTHVRADLAFAQSVVETGFFSFPAGGQLVPRDNNFAGIGACDTCAHGWTFPSALTGVTAQMQLLDAYASPEPVLTNLVGDVGVGGCCPTWIELAGTWASSLRYGISIMTVYDQMLTWVIPQRLIAAGLLALPKPAPVRGATVASRTSGAGKAANPGSVVPALTAQPALAAQAVKP